MSLFTVAKQALVKAGTAALWQTRAWPLRTGVHVHYSRGYSGPYTSGWNVYTQSWLAAREHPKHPGSYQVAEIVFQGRGNVSVSYYNNQSGWNVYPDKQAYTAQEVADRFAEYEQEVARLAQQHREHPRSRKSGVAYDYLKRPTGWRKRFPATNAALQAA